MKYIKLFEKIAHIPLHMKANSEKIWKVPAKDAEEYIVALDKIGMSIDEIEHWIEFIKPGEKDYILVHSDDGIIRGDWKWSGADSSNYLGQKYVDSENYQGEVKVTPEDIEIYHLKKTAKKYNL